MKCTIAALVVLVLTAYAGCQFGRIEERRRNIATTRPPLEIVIEVEHAVDLSGRRWTRIAPDADCRRTREGVECYIWPQENLGVYPVPTPEDRTVLAHE